VIWAATREVVDLAPNFALLSTFSPRDGVSTAIPIESVDVYNAFYRADFSPEIVYVSSSDFTQSQSSPSLVANDPWSTSAFSEDLPVNFPPLSRLDGGRARPSTFHVDGTSCRIDDWMHRVCRRRAAVRAALSPPCQLELITYVDAPCYFRDEPRPADGGMPRFATQMEAEAAHKAAMEGLSTESMTWEEYAATHPHESIGAPPIPHSQSFPERREG
jgi:hypothetical protein